MFMDELNYTEYRICSADRITLKMHSSGEWRNIPEESKISFLTPEIDQLNENDKIYRYWAEYR